MAFLENGDMCGLEEYNRSLHQRIDESQLRTEELYMLMLLLKGQGEDKAGKQPVRAVEVQRKTGLATVRFAFLDDDLTQTCTTV